MKSLCKCLYLAAVIVLAAVGYSQTAKAASLQTVWGSAGVYLDGREIDADSAEDAVERYIEKRMNRFLVLEAGDTIYQTNSGGIGLTWINPGLMEVMNIALAYDGEMQAKIPFDFKPEFDFNPDILVPYIKDIIQKESISVVNGWAYKDTDGLIKMTDGVTGRVFSAEKVMEELLPQLLLVDGGRLDYTFPSETVYPEWSSQNVSFSYSPLGEYTTYNLGMPGRVRNIEISAGGINGTMVMPGETLSALAMYGAVTAAGGYQEAPVYNGGRQIMGIGGGICQTTTTLYNACLRAELEIVYRRQHSMIVNYVPPSWDAMVDYASGSDFVARNNTGYPIYLEASTGIDQDGDSYINIRVWGTETRPANRTVEFTYEVLACQFPSELFRVNTVSDSLCLVGMHSPDKKIYAEVEVHPFVQSRAYKIVKVDGVEQSRTMLPATYGSCDQYKQMSGTVYHASDCLVTYWIVDDPNTYLGKRVHYQVMFKNGEGWDQNDPMGYYEP